MSPTDGPIDSLRLSNRDCEQMLRNLDMATRPVEEGENQRGEYDRVDVSNDMIAVVKLLPADSRPTQFRIRCRNISSTGIGFLHGQFIYEKTPCEIILINGQQQGFQLHAKVVRCRFIEKHVHEVGIQFASPVDIKVIMGAAA